jgi:hypothetical protein
MFSDIDLKVVINGHASILAVVSVLSINSFQKLSDQARCLHISPTSSATDTQVQWFWALGLRKTFQISTSSTAESKLGISASNNFLHIDTFLTDYPTRNLEILVILNADLKSTCELPHRVARHAGFKVHAWSQSREIAPGNAEVALAAAKHFSIESGYRSAGILISSEENCGRITLRKYDLHMCHRPVSTENLEKIVVCQLVTEPYTFNTHSDRPAPH